MVWGVYGFFGCFYLDSALAFNLKAYDTNLFDQCIMQSQEGKI